MIWHYFSLPSRFLLAFLLAFPPFSPLSTVPNVPTHFHLTHSHANTQARHRASFLSNKVFLPSFLHPRISSIRRLEEMENRKLEGGERAMCVLYCTVRLGVLATLFDTWVNRDFSPGYLRDRQTDSQTDNFTSQQAQPFAFGKKSSREVNKRISVCIYVTQDRFFAMQLGPPSLSSFILVRTLGYITRMEWNRMI